MKMLLCKWLGELYLLVHHRVYEKRRRNAQRFENHFVISIGNLSTGGTGKTPFTIHLSRLLLENGYRVLICLRGYKGKLKQSTLVADSNGIYASAEIAGDEAILIAMRLTEALATSSANSSLPSLSSLSSQHSQTSQSVFAVAAGADRRKLIESFGGGFDVVLLDDAFQNPLVSRDLEIVLIDATVPVSRLQVLPCGSFRESIDALSRADMVCISRANLAYESAVDWSRLVRSAHASLPVFGIGLSTESQVTETEKTVAAFCGIGNPESFFTVLEQSGFTVAERHIFRDHHLYTDADLNRLSQSRWPLITTEKDAARLGARIKKLGQVKLLRTELFEMTAQNITLKSANDAGYDQGLFTKILAVIKDVKERNNLQ